MFGLDTTIFAITISIIGIGFLILTPILLRLVPYLLRSSRRYSPTSVIETDLPTNENAVILVRPGGQIVYINEQAREWFSLLENESPNIERMSRNTRPTDTFLNLCAAAGHARFNLHQLLIEGTSYYVPHEREQAVLVTMQRPQLTGLDSGESDISSQAITIFNEISQSMSSSLDLETTINTILENIDKLIPSDISEITLLDQEKEYLIPYRFLVDNDGVRRLRMSTDSYKTDQGYSGYLITNNKPLLVKNVSLYTDVRPAVSRHQFPFNSFLGLPLEAAGKQIGTIELASQTPEAFNQGDLEILETLSGHAATALQNAITHFKEQQRATEMAGLAELAQVSSTIYETDELYQHLVESISPLLNVEILGFLIYNEISNTLEGQTPFQGFPDQVTDGYQIEIKTGTSAEKIWQEQDIIITDDMSEDSAIGLLGLSPMAQAAGLRETVLLPLTSGRRSLGYLQAANKLDGSMFNEDDLRLLRIIAGHLAPILENAELIQQSRRRTRRAEALRRVASLAGSGAIIEYTLKFSILALSNFLQADVAAAFLLDEHTGKLQPHRESQVGLEPENIDSLYRFLSSEANLSEMVTGTTLPLISPDMREDLSLSRTYKIFHQILPEISSVMIIPLIVRDRGIGEIFIGSKQKDFFIISDSQSVATAGGQLASAIERSTLINQTDESLQQRVDQLTAINRLSNELNTTKDLDNLLQQVFDEILRATRADDCVLLMFESKANNTDPQEILFQKGHLQDGQLSDLDRQVLEKGEPLIIENFAQSPFKPSTLDSHSAMVVPIIYQGNINGLIHLHSRKPNYFNDFSLEITQTLAVQAAIAFNNLQRYQEEIGLGVRLARQVETFGKVLETNQSIQLEMPLEESFHIIAKGIQDASLFDIILIYTYESTHETLSPIAGVGLPQEQFNQIHGTAVPLDQLNQLFQPKYRRHNSYFIPYSEELDGPFLIPEYALMALTIPEDSENAWQPGDRLLIPLLNAQSDTLGVIAVDAPRNGLRPDDLSIENLEIFASEAALVIESFKKVNELKDQMKFIEKEITQTGQTSQSTLEHLPVLLKKDLEQTIAIQQLYDRARNIRVGLDIAETVNRQPNRESVLTSLASQMLTEMELDIALLAEPVGGGARLLNQFGPLPQGANPQAMLGQRNPLSHTILTGETIFVSNLEEDVEWKNSALLKSLDTKGFISLPISSNGQVEAALLAVSNTPLPDLTKEDEQIYDLISNQVSITLQNLNLLTETRRRLREVNLLLDFSRQLGSLDPNEILSTLVTSIRQVMPNAHGAMVSLWENDKNALVTQVATGYTDNELIKEIPHAPGDSLVSQTYTKGQTVIIDEVDFAAQYNLSPDNLLRYREATGGRLPVSSLMVPINTTDSVLGVVTLDNFNTPAAFENEDIALVESLTQQSALTLENAHLFEESRRLNEELEQRVAERTEELAREHQFTNTLLRISNELSSSLDLDMVLNRSLETLNDVTKAEHSTIVIIRPPESHLIYRAGAGIHEAPPTGGRISALKIGEGLAGWVIQNRSGVVIPDLLMDERWKKDHGVTTIYRSAIAVPLIVGADALGCLMLYHREPEHFREDQVDAIQAAANQFAVTINNGELFRLIRDQAEDLGKHLRSQQIEASRSTAMLESVADGVLVTDTNSIITLFNDAAEQILELKRDQLIGKSLDDFIGLFGGAAQSWMGTIRKWSNDPGSQNDAIVYSERLSLEDGRVISVHLAPVSDPKEYLGTVSIFRDITHEVEVDRLKSEFVATVSHELRTPMTPIKGYVEFLLMGGAGELSEQQIQFMDIIKSNIDRLSILVNDLLDVSRIEAGKVALSFQPIDIKEVIDDVTQNVYKQSSDEERPVTFEIYTPDELPSVYGDIERVRQIFSNLVDNAYKYAPENSKITLNVTVSGDTIQSDIIDEGIGIFPDEQERIFNRFYRGENHLVMATAGTGLGLSIVKELVEMHNGRIWVTSSGVPGEGSVFSFVLPIYKSEKKENTTP